MDRSRIVLVVLGSILAIAASVVVIEIVEAQEEAAPKRQRGWPPREFRMVEPPTGPIIRPRVSPPIMLCLGPFDQSGYARLEDCP